MKIKSLSSLCLFLVILFPYDLMATDYQAEADKLFEQGGLENYKQALELYKKAIAANPGSY